MKRSYKGYLKEIIILIIQLFMFYIYPLFCGPTDAIAMVLIILVSTFILSIVLSTISTSNFRYLYPLFVSIIFIPSIFIYYNISALVHSLWYFVVSLIGMIIGIIFKKILKIK